MVCDLISENLIKGIIVSYSRTGVTIQQIANRFYQIAGESWPFYNQGESQAKRYLEQMDGILSIVNENNDLLWYVRGKSLNGGNHGRIYRASNQTKSDFNLSTSPHGNAPNTCNNNNLRYNTRAKVDRNYNGFNSAINGNHEPRRKQKQFANYNVRSSGYGSHSDCSNESDQRTTASLYNYDLVGDDFFMELARIDLQCGSSNRKVIQQSGMCISGQRIRDVSERLKRFPYAENMKIIVNIGSVDILHGRDLSDMCHDFNNLIKICDRRGIHVVITTLAPIANRLHVDSDTNKWMDFNAFLIQRFSTKHLVIDIVPCMMDPKTRKVLFECYQPSSKYTSGSSQPHTLWNRIGRQRVLKAIKARLRF